MDLPAIPPGPLLPWVAQNPAAAAQYLETVRALAQLRVVITQNGVSRTGTLRLTPQGALIQIDL